MTTTTADWEKGEEAPESEDAAVQEGLRELRRPERLEGLWLREGVAWGPQCLQPASQGQQQ